MKKKNFLDIYCHYMAAWYIRFLRKKYDFEYGYIQEKLEKARMRAVYLFGIKVLKIYEYEKNRMFFLFGLLPTLLITDTGAKACMYLGRFELWKERRAGMLQFPDGGFLMERRPPGGRRLFYHIGALKRNPSGTGIPRTAASLLAALLKEHSGLYEVIPVCSRENAPGFCSAFDEVRQTFPFLKVTGEDGPALFSAGDVLFFPIPDVREVESQYHVLKFLKERGVRVCFIAYDVIILRHPEFFTASLYEEMKKWFEHVSEFNGILAISRSAEQDYLRWRQDCGIPPDEKFFTSWFHLGSDIRMPVSSRGLPESSESVLAMLKSRVTFLEVSTIEPRKGYGQALEAFERLWEKGLDINFVIVGKKGWKMDAFLHRLESHAEMGRRLFWLRDISDEYLDKVYDAASCVLFPSEAEGFGLAVIEGAQHGKPLILRDIPVFREIAGEHAAYFSGLDPQPLVDCIEQWLKDRKNGCVIPSSGIKPLTWEESARMLLSRLESEEFPQ